MDGSGLLTGKQNRKNGRYRPSILDLVSRSLFERSPFDEQCFVMHDLIHDLAQWAVGDICCCVMGTMDMERDLKRTRHLNLIANFADKISRIDQSVVAQLRTFICPVEEFIDDAQENIDDLKIGFKKFILRFHYIRTLQLASKRIEELPECIGDLKHLRFLNLEFTKLKVLPKSISKLCNLQTLFLTLSDDKRELTAIKDLVKLRHLRLKWQTDDIEVDDNTRRDVLEQLKPPTCLEECELEGYMGLKFPGWVGDRSFNNMVDIRLVDCRKCQRMPPLGQLPKLEKLLVWEMDEISQVGLEFYGGLGCSNSFPRLKTLEFERMSSWEKWLHPMVDNNKALFPQLEKLSIKECTSLQGNLPSYLPLLRILDISYCDELSVSLLSTPPLLEELLIEECKAFSFTDTSAVIFCSKRLVLNNIGSVCTDLIIGGPCREELHIYNCGSLMTVNQVPVTLGRLIISNCPELRFVEFKKSSLSLASSKVNISIIRCESLVEIGLIPLTVERVDISNCVYLNSLWFSDKTQEAGEEACSSGVKRTIANGAGFDTDLGVSNKQQQVSHYFPSQIELPHLTILIINCCPNLIFLPDDLFLPSIQQFKYLLCEKLEALPKQLHSFASLETLCIKECPKIQKFPEGGLPRSLKTLEISCMKITQPIGDWGLHHLTQLQNLTLIRTGWLSGLVGCIPGPDLYLPSSLSFLRIVGFPNMKAISCSSFPNLTQLSIVRCPMLKSLGDKNCLPPNLKQVWVSDCPLMQRACKPDPDGVIHINTEQYSLS